MKLDTGKLQQIFQVVDRVGAHAGLLSSQYLRISQENGRLALALTGLVFSEASLEIPPESRNGKGWKYYIDRRPLGAFLSMAKGKMVELTPGKGELTWKCGRGRLVSSSVEEISGYSTWQNGEKTRSLAIPDDLRNELDLMSFYAPITAAADHLSAVYLLKGYGVLATDSFIIAARRDESIPETFPIPVVLAKLIHETKTKQIVREKNGAALLLDSGYLYQMLSARVATDYPLKAVKALLEKATTVKPPLALPAKKFFSVLTGLKGFVFGSDAEVMVECHEIGGKAEFSLVLNHGQAHRILEVSRIGPEKFRWPIGKLLPWVEFVAGLKNAKETEIGCALFENCNLFTARIGKRRYDLLIAEQA